MPTGLVHDSVFLRHVTGPKHPERVERLQAIDTMLSQSGLMDQLVVVPLHTVSEKWLLVMHDKNYLHRIHAACSYGVPYVDVPDSVVCRASELVAKQAVGGCLTAASKVMAGELSNAFCALRPPGHHAERDRSMGFCLFNNIAITAEYLIKEHGLERIAIVDFDAHHGNGTQHLFEDRSDVLFISLHEDPMTQYPETGFANETGKGIGTGYTLNIPMPVGSEDAVYLKAFNQQVLPRLREYQPQFLLISAGFDAAPDDPLGHLCVSTQGFGWMSEQLIELAGVLCKGRVVSMLEGGYDLPSLTAGVQVHIEALLHANVCSANV
ncbi:MAG: histone deacetylase [Phycisphaeraceae bacterium]|nr:histone deacetylase [Phycisphaeraceae bacterium]